MPKPSLKSGAFSEVAWRLSRNSPCLVTLITLQIKTDNGFAGCYPTNHSKRPCFEACPAPSIKMKQRQSEVRLRFVRGAIIRDRSKTGQDGSGCFAKEIFSAGKTGVELDFLRVKTPFVFDFLSAKFWFSLKLFGVSPAAWAITHFHQSILRRRLHAARETFSFVLWLVKFTVSRT